jgi:hypothetical protein
VGWVIQRCEEESESCAGFELSFYFNGLHALGSSLLRALFQR